MKNVEFEYSGHIDDDALKIADDIASGVYSAEDAWKEVDELDDTTQNSIYAVGIFVEY